MRLRGLVYRAHNPQWAWTPASGEGARRYGGRFNRRGVPALYLSFSPITAIREAQPVGRPMQPLTLCAYEIDAEPVFDAENPAELRRVGADPSDVACPTWEADMLSGGVAASQDLADRLAAAGHVGMRVRSFAVGAERRDLNLVMWRWGNDYPIRAVVIDEEGRLTRA